jgi:UDP-N-acetylglucosamine 2-epimerase (hydrolysing)
MAKNKKLLFITGTRADWGKIKPLINAVIDSDKNPALYRPDEMDFACSVFVTGMHMLSLYGLTMLDVKRDFDIYPYMNMEPNSPMDDVLASTIAGLGKYVREFKPDMIIVHGDRVEALAGASVGVLNNILVAHIEGGELSGTVDGIIRHAVSKLSHIHFTANEDSSKRLFNMGESNVFTIGSPDIDVMLGDLPPLDEVKKHYGIPYDDYSIFLYHPVTSELNYLERDILETALAAIDSKRKWVAIYPNNDTGADEIIEALGNFEIVIPSMRFEYFLTLLKNADCILGNSSAGIREAQVYGVPSINVGTRQDGRSKNCGIINVPPNYQDITNALNNLPVCEPSTEFGRGNAAKLFVHWLKTDELWKTKTQKQFCDVVK